MTLLIIAAVFVVGAALAFWLGRRMRNRAQRAVTAYAAQTGLRYTERDDRLASLDWGAPFGDGRDWQVTQVLTGERFGHRVMCCNFQYAEAHHGTSGDRRHFGSAIGMTGPASIGQLEVHRATQRELTHALGGDDVLLESEDFNRTFRVRGDARFVSAVLDPRMMQFLLDQHLDGFRIAGADFVVIRSRWLRAGDLDRELDQLAGVIDRVPGFLWRAA